MNKLATIHPNTFYEFVCLWKGSINATWAALELRMFWCIRAEALPRVVPRSQDPFVRCHMPVVTR